MCIDQKSISVDQSALDDQFITDDKPIPGNQSISDDQYVSNKNVYRANWYNRRSTYIRRLICFR